MMRSSADTSDVDDGALASPQPPERPTVQTAQLADLVRVWKGDSEDWSRCYAVMHGLNRDGRKLEAWRYWLSSISRASLKGKETRPNNHESDVSSSNPSRTRSPSFECLSLEHVREVLHDHVRCFFVLESSPY